MTIQTLHLRSNVQGKEPVAGSATGQLPVGSIAINYNKDEPFLSIQDSAGVIRRIAGIKVSATAPASPTAGETWLDTTIATKPVFKVFDGTAWQGAGSGTSTGGTQPTSPLEGDLWVDTSVAGSPVLKVYNGTSWVVVTPDATTTTKGIVQLADAAAVTAGTAGRVVDAAQLKAVADAVAAEDLWDKAGTDISPKTNGDSLQLKDGTGAVSVDLDAGASASPLVRDSSGRLLVGTQTSSATNTVVVQGHSGGSTGQGIVYLAKGAATPADGDQLGVIWFSDNTHTASAGVNSQRDGGTWSGSSKPSRLVFSTTADGASSPTERMRIKSDGHLQVTTDGGFGGLDGSSHGFRTTTANWVAQFANDQATAGDNFGVVIKYVSSAPNGTGNSFLLCGDSVTDRVQIRSNGGIANYSANNVNLSDRNAKKDIAPAAGTWDCLKEWEIVNFRYKDQPDDADLNMGVIAQQVAESCPEVITVFQEATEDQPEKLGIKDQQMMWMAIKALQEAQLRIETLEAEVAALKGV